MGYRVRLTVPKGHYVIVPISFSFDSVSSIKLRVQTTLLFLLHPAVQSHPPHLGVHQLSQGVDANAIFARELLNYKLTHGVLLHGQVRGLQ